MYILASRRPVTFPSDESVTLCLSREKILSFSPLAYFGGEDEMFIAESTDLKLDEDFIHIKIHLHSGFDIHYKRGENLLICKIKME